MILRYFGSGLVALVPTSLVLLILVACAQPQDMALESNAPYEVTVEQEASPPHLESITVAAKQRSSQADVSLGFAYAPSAHLVDQRSQWHLSPADTENYAEIADNPIKQAAVDPVSTFSVDVDTGSYSNARRFLNAGEMPPSDAIRIEEMINYFDYGYAPPRDTDTPFTVHTEVAQTPWNKDTYLLKVGLKGYEVPQEQRPAANLVFLLDVSGSMNAPDKLPLLVSSMKLLTQQLRADDRVTIVVYAGAAGLVLEPTLGSERAIINAALDRLSAGGSTAGGQGIELAYAMAQASKIPGGINRIILATDGDFNVGTVRVNSLKDFVAQKRETGVSLSVLGFGRGNLNDQMVEQLSNVGNGSYAYIDTLKEGRKVLVEQVGSTLMTIAKDTKIQIEFNPAVIGEYRLIGYTNRMLAHEDFNNDKVDAGDIGAGHSVTALYEIALVGSGGLQLDPLRYGQRVSPPNGPTNEFAFVKLRYKLPNEDTSTLIEIPLETGLIEAADPPSDDFRFAAAVAAFGEKLRGGEHLGSFGYRDVETLALRARGSDPFGYRAEFLELVRLANAMQLSGLGVPPCGDFGVGDLARAVLCDQVAN
ncbi:MAG: vWA domain-containing protein [Alphaproteobacteria bacterium]